MAELTNENVEFFNSESSFGTEALSNSRLEDLADELVDESNTIFFSLQQILVPREDIVDQAALKQILHRARIMHRQTIPENMVVIQRSSNSERKAVDVKRSDDKLLLLLQHYDEFREQKMTYEKFYNLYGRGEIGNFSKKQMIQINIQPDIVQIYQNAMPKSLKGGQSKPNLLPSMRQGYKERELQQLKDEIHFLKKKQKNFLREKEESELRIKTQTDQRVKRLIKMHKSGDPSIQLETVKKELQKSQEELENYYKNNKNLNLTIEKLQQTIKELKLDNRIIKQELESNRRIALGASRFSDMSEGGRSNYSEVDGTGSSDVKKLQKIVKNLNYEKNLLRNELNKERQTFYKIKKNQQKDLEQEVVQLKKTVQKKNIQLSEVHKDIDRYKVENIKLTDQFQKMQKQLSLTKNSVENLEKMNFQESRYSNLQNSGKLMQNSRMESPRMMMKLNISSYTGDGDEGYPYFDLISKQFKIRFKRSCLRDKELLHKSNGLEVGVISEYAKPNEIKIMLHISNFCDQEPLKNIKLKTTNSKNNKILFEKTSFKEIEVGNQVKTPLHFCPKIYPLGSTILICQYEYYGKQEQVRILLPAHIFKMVTVKPRDGDFRNSSTIKVPIERKIGKNIENLKQYFKGALFEQNRIKSCFLHDQTQTKVLVDISESEQNYVIQFEHRNGDEMISQYLVKALAFLLRKEK